MSDWWMKLYGVFKSVFWKYIVRKITFQLQVMLILQAKNLGTRGKELKQEVEELFHRIQLEAKFNNKTESFRCSSDNYTFITGPWVL